MSHTDTSDNAPWRTHFRDLPISASPDFVTSRAASLVAAISADSELLGWVVGDMMCQADEQPKCIDTLLSIYKAIADSFKDNPSLKAHGFSGSTAVHKSFDVEILESTQTAGNIVEAYFPYDVSCRISAEEPLQGAVDRVLGFAEARRSWFVIHALFGRSRALGVGMESEIEPLEYDYALDLIRFGLGLSSGRDGQVPDEMNFLNALIMLLSAGHVLREAAKRATREIEFTEAHGALKTALRNESNFRRKYFIAHALKVLEGENQWTSARIFDEAAWVH